jgi:hypothetical protein
VSPDCFNQCPECDLILSVPTSKEQVNCPRCQINERRVVAMRLVPLDVPLRSHFEPRWGRAAKAA